MPPMISATTNASVLLLRNMRYLPTADVRPTHATSAQAIDSGRTHTPTHLTISGSTENRLAAPARRSQSYSQRYYQVAEPMLLLRPVPILVNEVLRSTPRAVS